MNLIDKEFGRAQRKKQRENGIRLVYTNLISTSQIVNFLKGTSR